VYAFKKIITKFSSYDIGINTAINLFEKYLYIQIWNASIMKVIRIDFSAGSFIFSDAFTIPSPTGLAFIKI